MQFGAQKHCEQRNEPFYMMADVVMYTGVLVCSLCCNMFSMSICEGHESSKCVFNVKRCCQFELDLTPHLLNIAAGANA